MYHSAQTYVAIRQPFSRACRNVTEKTKTRLKPSDALWHRFFVVFEYEPQMKAAQNNIHSIVERLNEEADTARRYLDACELEVLEPRFSDNFLLQLLYEIINKRTSRRVKLPEGVFDMTTAIHGVYEE